MGKNSYSQVFRHIIGVFLIAVPFYFVGAILGYVITGIKGGFEATFRG